MADVGDLRVRLSLDNAQFERSVASMNRTLQAMGQEIRGLQNRGREWGSTIEGLRSKQEAYSRLLEGQQTKVRRLAEEYEKAKQQYGEHSEQAERLAVQLNRASAEMDRTERELRETTAELERQERELARSQTTWARFGEAASAAGEKLKTVGNKMKDVGKELSLKVTAPLTALGVGATKAAIDFESAFAGVRKTVDTSEEGFKKLEKGILEMARTLPASAAEIAGVAESAGQLGIAEENILSFSKTIIDLGESTNLSLEQAASEFARFSNITGMSQTNFDRLGSSVVALGNSMATTESEIVEMGMRLAAQGKQVGMSEAQIMALAGTMSSLGIQAEMGGTAMTTILKKIQSAVGSGGKDLTAFAKAAGMTGAEFKKAFETDAVTALDLLVKGLAKSSEGGANLTTILANLGIKGVYESDVLLRLAGASDLLSSAVDTSTNAWKENTALTNEAEQRYATTAAQLAMLKNKVVEVGISFGSVLLPFLIQIVDTLSPIVMKFAEIDKTIQIVIMAIAGIVAAIGPLLVVGGVLISSIGSIVSAFGVFSSAMAVVTTGVAAATPGVGALAGVITALSGPIGIAIAAIGGLTIGTIAFAKHMSNDALPSVERFGKKVSDSTKEALNGFFDLSENASQSVTNMYVTSTKVTSEMAKELTSQFDEMNKKIVEGMKKRNADQLSDLQNFFMNSSALSSEEEQKIIADTQKRNEWELQEQNTMNERVKAIMQKAADEKRELTEREHEVINNYNQSMKENAVRTFSESELEQKVILERMKENASIISAEQAAEVVKNAVKQKEDVLKEANETYEKRIAQIIQMRDETGVISAEQADKMIAEATKARDQTVLLAEEQHQKIVETAQKQADEHVEKVNWETGEILSKWEVFKNKHADIFNLVEEKYKLVTDSLKEITTTAYDYIKTTVNEKLGFVVDFVKEQLDKLKEFWDENGEAIFAIVKFYFENIKSNIEMVMGIIKGIFEIVWPVIAGLVKITWSAMKFTIGSALDVILGIIQTVLKLIQGDWKGAWETVKKTVEKIWSNIEQFFRDVDLVQIGKDIINGLIKGIGSMADAVWEKVESIADGITTTAKRILGIKSPSRVFMAIGRDTIQGMEIGMAEREDTLNAVMKDLTNNLLDITDHYKSEEKKITDKANADISKIEKRSKEDVEKILRTAASKKRKTTQDENIKIQRIQEDANKKIAEIEKKATKESVNLLTKDQQEKLKEIKLFIDDKKSLGELSLEEEAQIWKESLDQFDLYSKERVTAQKAYNKAIEDINKRDLEEIKQYIADKKSSEELSLVEEAKIWERTIGLFEEGSKERIDAQKNYKKAFEAVNKEILSVNKDFQGQMQTIVDDLTKQEEQLNKTYDDVYNKRKSTLMSYAGTFDEFKVELNRTSTELIGNLQSQVDGFKQWQDQFAKLSERGIDADLLKELSELGVKALPELAALNSMTDDQLTKYSELYREKSQLAREQTEKELVGMREDTDMQIQKLREAANDKLNLIQKEWDKAIRNLTRTTANELSSLQQIGIDAGQGLLNGLESMRGPLIDKATEIANSIKEAMQGALDIHSPSRVMKGFGINIAEGLIQGMNSMIAQVEQSSTGLANAVIGGQNSYDYSKQFSPSVKIYTQDSGSREMERTLRRMAFGF
ncbi:phage tail tape measure protein [Lysinibacillus sp. NPDC093210]|uniref:phage tail tape measure protein n=1 Tax=Lysinibacillus sp. NPDC093210 TaxID=3364133 RepID=UPI0037F933F8